MGDDATWDRSIKPDPVLQRGTIKRNQGEFF